MSTRTPIMFAFGTYYNITTMVISLSTVTSTAARSKAVVFVVLSSLFIVASIFYGCSVFGPCFGMQLMLIFYRIWRENKCPELL